MSGLLRNYYYGALGSAKILLTVFVAIGIALLITGNGSLLMVFALVGTTTFAFNAVSSMRKEASTNWNKYELVTPVRRKEIVKSRYLNHFGWCAIGLILTAGFVCLTVAVHGNRFFYHEVRDPLTLFVMAVGIPLLMGALFYPAIYTFGSDKSEIMMILSILGSIAITFGVIWLINSGNDFTSLSDIEYYLCLSIYALVVAVSLMLSYFITVVIYKKKEF